MQTFFISFSLLHKFRKGIKLIPKIWRELWFESDFLYTDKKNYYFYIILQLLTYYVLNQNNYIYNLKILFDWLYNKDN